MGKLDARIISAVMGVLEQAASRGGEARTVEVHLALLVAYRYARDAASVRAFWSAVGYGYVSGRLKHKPVEKPE